MRSASPVYPRKAHLQICLQSPPLKPYSFRVVSLTTWTLIDPVSLLETEPMLHHLPSEFMLFRLHTAILCTFDFLFQGICLQSAALLPVSISPYSSQTQPQHSRGLHTLLLMRSIVGGRGNGPVKDFRPCRIGWGQSSLTECFLACRRPWVWFLTTTKHQ